MDEIKPWYLSRTVWASVVAILAGACGVVGVPSEVVADPELVDAILRVVAAVAAIVSLFGRLKAKSRLRA